ncbi:uncharacterized protein LOC135954286 [Calliphora vicina]|uniref:uncharacterized protein LOC135954286 n=1 Tax=Calliphora vicina TaxID=7373 RepID=UPI00325B3488
MDKFKLIAEIRKRPALWDNRCEERKSKKTIQAAWKDVAVAMGSDVKDCSRIWKNLRTNNRDVVKKIELRIEKDKLNGTYDPNNEYLCQWIYYKPMRFINDNKSDDNDSDQVAKSHNMDENNSLDELEMSNAMDEFKLIAEIRKRPALWDTQSKEHKSCLSVPDVWKDLAVSMESDVDTCKQIWNKLCLEFRERKKRIELCIKEDKLKGLYDPNNEYISKWAYFKDMLFLKDITSSHVNDSDDSDQFSKFHNLNNIKVESEVDLEPEVYLPDDGDDDDSQMHSIEFLSEPTSPQNLELADDKPSPAGGNYSKRSNNQANLLEVIEEKPGLDLLDEDTVSQMYSKESHKMDNIKMEPELDLKPEIYLPDDEDDDTDSQEFVSIQKSPQTQGSADDKPSSTGGKYTKRSYDQAKLKDLEEKEHNLIKSARLDGKTSNDMIHVGDSDYKFLVSLLPQMKKLTESQNIKFRVKMSDEMFNITSD